MNRNLEELFLRLLWKTINQLPEPWRTKDTGRPPYEPKTVALACMAKVMQGMTYEDTESWTKSSKVFEELTGYSGIPQSVIHRGMERMPKAYIKQACRRLATLFHRKGINVAFDASGFKQRTSSLWYDIRIKRKSRKKDFTKLHIAGCVDTGIIHSYTITAGKRHDSPQLMELVKEIDKIIKAVGDGAYCARKNCTAIAKKGGKPFFRLKCNVTAKPKSSPAWKAMVKLYFKDQKAWLKEYHVRSFIEAVFSSIKRRFGNFLCSIKKGMQEKELALKVVCYNVVRVLYIKTAKDLGVPLWVKA